MERLDPPAAVPVEIYELAMLLDDLEETDIVETAQRIAEERGDIEVLDAIDALIAEAPVVSSSDDDGWPTAARLGYWYLMSCDVLDTTLPHLSARRLAARAHNVVIEDIASRIT